MAERKRPPPGWAKGTSGNPAGRPKGIGKVQKLRDSLMAELPEILSTVVAMAKGGDPASARLILERVLPSMKAIEQPVAIQLGDGTLTQQGHAIIAAVATGQLAPGQGSQLLSGIAALARVIELDELTDRITALENQRGNA